MSAVLLHMLAWTGVLIAAVLLLRRPVARWFGPQVAYALWLLPLARLFLPPITLPAWMAPRAPLPEPAAIPVSVDTAATSQAMADVAIVPAEVAPAAGYDLLETLAGLPLAESLLLVWLAGAGVFLCRRFAAYFELRDALLAEGREVGRVREGFATVRLVETPGTPAPLAMGVLDPVIALPPGFMALHDRQARDLALAHELAHHRGGDLLVNVLVQPLFALHWFNPLGRYGWLALRRDQEAACDARVMAHRDAQDRAAYAALIARYAAAPVAAGNAALTAPMACPVLGEKSIIHRLRSLSMSRISLRRRLAGGALLGAGLLTLPLTASFSYAASDPAQAVPAEAPEPPAAPTPPAPPHAPEAPDAPQPPAPPEAPLAFVFPDGEGDSEGDGKTIVSERTTRSADGKERTVRIVRRTSAAGEPITVDLARSEWMSEQEHAEMTAALREGLAEAERVRAEMRQTLAFAMMQADKAREHAEAARAAAPEVMVLKDCTSAFPGQAQVINGKDGKKTIMICQPRIQALAMRGFDDARAASARRGLEQARAEIARDREIPETTRKEMIQHLDRQIARLADKES
ncbi:M56 family metallopeptidase [Porphyrobacter sp. AAP60]|uniref:M56 family metallopeptidase n=1 Tax=Porphyrobacter sp. AAP60 TaxID=1523423 RepID=UPI0006BA0352|nr:M56 family metallopeptidase [Porphyrobacter sp. AAP60]KPF65331.1 hypothetical protein IP79_04035 [Porphyrobacter sp. AAP60]